MLPILSTSLTHFSLKGWENVLAELGVNFNLKNMNLGTITTVSPSQGEIEQLRSDCIRRLYYQFSLYPLHISSLKKLGECTFELWSGRGKRRMKGAQTTGSLGRLHARPTTPHLILAQKTPKLAGFHMGQDGVLLGV